MDQEAFRVILAQFTNPDPLVVQEAGSFLSSMAELQLPLYLRCHLIHLATAEGDDPTYRLSSTLLDRGVGSHLISSDPSIAEESWRLFTEFSSPIFANPFLTDKIKATLASALARLYVSLNRAFPGDYFTFLAHLLTSNPDFEPFVLTCLADIIPLSNPPPGIPEDFLIGILSNPSSSPLSLLPQFRLFTSTAACFPDSDVLAALFPSYLEHLPPQFLDAALCLLDDFATTSAAFFGHHLLAFSNYLTTIASSTELPAQTRNTALFCLESMFEGAPEMCQSCVPFFASVFACLIQVIAEIPPDATLDPDANDIAPYRTALDVLSLISGQWCKVADHPLLPVVTELFSKQIEWQLQCAGMLALANFRFETDSYDGPWVALVLGVLPIAADVSNLVLMRVAALSMLEAALPPKLWPDAAVASILECLFGVLTGDDHPRVKLVAVRCLSTFSRAADKSLPAVMEVIDAAAAQATPEMIPYIAGAIGRIASPINLPRPRDGGALVRSGLTALCALLAQSEGQVVTRIEIVWAISVALGSYVALSEEAQQLALSAFRELWGLRNASLDETTQDHWRDAITTFVGLVHRAIAPARLAQSFRTHRPSFQAFFLIFPLT
jgi:hypothetical protein